MMAEQVQRLAYVRCGGCLEHDWHVAEIGAFVQCFICHQQNRVSEKNSMAMPNGLCSCNRALPIDSHRLDKSGGVIACP